MELSAETLAILKNFSNINQSISVSPGNSLRTIKVSKTVLAEAKISEKFESGFAIYNLNQFLNSVNLLGSANLDFSHEKYMILTEGKRKIKYFYADPSIIVSPPDKKMSLPSQDVCFVLDQTSLDKIIKAKQIFCLDDLSVVGDGEKIELIVQDKKNDTSNEYSIEVGTTTEKFCMNFKIENLQFFPGGYEVVLSKKNIAKFSHQKMSLVYWVAMEPDSKFETNE
jgi:hypothetical protein